MLAKFLSLQVGCSLLIGVLGLNTFVSKADVLDDTANLRILSARSKVLTVNAAYFNERLKEIGAPTTKEDLVKELEGKTDCGSVSIGNQYTESSFANEVTIIIVGDITNVGNVCTSN